MEMLKSSTIWESASRPLFVRSTWLEAEKTGRASARRHFILDYEPRQRRVHSKSAASIRRSNAHGATLQHSHSYDFVGDLSVHKQCGFAEEPTRDLLLIAPAKVTHLPPTAQQLFQQKYPATKSTPATASRTQKRTLFFRNRALRPGPLQELYELYSRHSSLQDLQSTLSQANSHADERLAERVLNWLDLAGKRLDTQPNQAQAGTQLDISEMVKRPKKSTAKAAVAPGPMAASGAANSSKTSTQRPATTQTQSTAPHLTSTATRARKQVRYASTARTEQPPVATQKNPLACPTDAVKHITIIFDREGVPVRFNRPVRNIDLCSLSTNPGIVRRMAGQLASARLYSEAERAPAVHTPLKSKPCSSQRRSSGLDYVGYAGRATQKRSHDTAVFDAKKQLHIFMPNLPKKGLLTALGTSESGCGSTMEDTYSGLSNTFSEFCKI